MKNTKLREIDYLLTIFVESLHLELFFGIKYDIFRILNLHYK